MHFVNTERINKVVIHFKSSSICVSSGFGSLTGESSAVRLVASSNQTGRFKVVRPATSIGVAGDLRAVGLVDLYRSDRRHLSSQTSRSISVRPISVLFEGNFYFR